MAGNASAPASLTFRVDSAAPRIQLSDVWYLWETGVVNVSDDQSGLAGVEIQIHDPQGRWQKVVRSYEANGSSFSASIAWDRTFADGILAPVGTYDVMVTARDLAGNESRETARLLIPAPGVTPAPLPTRRVEPAETRTPQPTPTAMATLSASLPAPTATRSMVVQSFQSSSPLAAAPHSPFTTPHSSFPLWGAAATAAIAAATGLALAERKRRKEEEARQLAEAQREAARKNAAEEARKAQAYLLAQAVSHRSQDRKIERMDTETSLARLETHLKAHFRRPADKQPPSDVVVTPPLTAGQ